MYLIPVLPKELRKQAQWNIYAICAADGQSEVEDFLTSLPPNMQASAEGMVSLLTHVAEKGPQNLPDTLCHTVADGIWEFIKGRLRVFWFYDRGKVVICTHGLIKKGQKTPQQDIQTAQSCKRDYDAAMLANHVEILEGE